MYKYICALTVVVLSGCALDANRNIPYSMRTKECVHMLRMVENTTVYQKVSSDDYFKKLIQDCERSIH